MTTPIANALAPVKETQSPIETREYQEITVSVTTGAAVSHFDKLPNNQPLEDREIKPMLLRLIRLAQQSIWIAAFTYDDADITQELVAAHGRGVAIRISLDYEQCLGNSSAKKQKDTIARLLEWHSDKAPVEIYVVKPRLAASSRNAVEHSKFSIYDGVIAVFGSANFTGNSLDICGEFCELTKIRGTVQALQAKSSRHVRDGTRLTHTELAAAIARKKERDDESC